MSCFGLLLFVIFKGPQDALGTTGEAAAGVFVAVFGVHVECLSAVFPADDYDAAVEMFGKDLPDLGKDLAAGGRRSGFLLAAHDVGVMSKGDASGEPAFMRLQAWGLV